jgi:membrane-bound ClpP family serine protease
MLDFSEKEIWSRVLGITIHKPELNETTILTSITAVFCIFANNRMPAIWAWGLIGAIVVVVGSIELVPRGKPLLTVASGILMGSLIMYIFGNVGSR